MTDIIKKNFGEPESLRTFLDGSKRTVVILKSLAIGRGEYLPGWKWSKHAGPQTEKPSGSHVGYIISGQMVIRAPDGNEIEVSPGEAFEMGPGHDAWVVGKEPCIALDFTRI